MWMMDLIMMNTQLLVNAGGTLEVDYYLKRAVMVIMNQARAGQKHIYIDNRIWGNGVHSPVWLMKGGHEPS